MKNVDLLLTKKYDKWRREQAKKGSNEPAPQAQVALIALDPRTGEIKAIIGGGDYRQSQPDDPLAPPQPRPVFQPLVFAAAFANGRDRVQRVLTPRTTHPD